MATSMIDLQGIAARIRDAATQPTRVVVFGSVARGEAGAESDLDLLVIQERVVDSLTETMRLRDAIGSVGLPVDLVLVSRSKADRDARRPMSLVAHALSDGLELAA